MDKRIAMFPGSFDPPTFGHLDIINRACEVFDKVYVVIAVNDSKSYLFSSTERKNMLSSIYRNNKKLEVVEWNGLTVEFAKIYNVGVIVRGFRNINDLEYESKLRDAYNRINPELEILYFASNIKYKDLSSSQVKDFAYSGADLSSFVPEIVMCEIAKKTVVC